LAFSSDELMMLSLHKAELFIAILLRIETAWLIPAGAYFVRDCFIAKFSRTEPLKEPHQPPKHSRQARSF
jgi:hypothetical protein